MSYRTWINVNEKSFQFLGNNEYCIELINYLKFIGCDVDNDGCYSEFEIKDIDAIIKIVENYIEEQAEHLMKMAGVNIFDLTPSIRTKRNGLGFTENMRSMRESAIIFLSAELLDFLISCGCVSYDHNYNEYGKAESIRYKLLDGFKVTVNAS